MDTYYCSRFKRPLTGPEPAHSISMRGAEKAARIWGIRGHRRHWDFLNRLKQAKGKDTGTGALCQPGVGTVRTEQV
jgi:hypothetical protein